MSSMDQLEQLLHRLGLTAAVFTINNGSALAKATRASPGSYTHLGFYATYQNITGTGCAVQRYNPDTKESEPFSFVLDGREYTVTRIFSNAKGYCVEVTITARGKQLPPMRMGVQKLLELFPLN